MQLRNQIPFVTNTDSVIANVITEIRARSVAPIEIHTNR